MTRAKDLENVAVQLARNDFGVFCKLVLKQKVGDMHRQMIQSVVEDPRHLCIMAARGHFKTTVMTVAFPLWIAFSEKEKPDDILLISASLDQAMKNIRLIKKAVEDNPLLKEFLYPDKVDARWSASELELKNGWRIKAVPFGDAVRGNHPKYAILDDVLKDESTNVEESKNKFYSIVFPIVQAKRGKLVVVGTPFNYEDLLHELARKPETFKFLFFPALLDEGKATERAQFPEHFSIEQLRRIKESIPAAAWAKEYMCNPVSGANALFPSQAIDACRNSKHPDGRPVARIMAYDVALTEKDSSDYSAYTIADLYENGFLDVVECDRYKMNTSMQIEEIKRLVKTRAVDVCLMDRTGVGAGLFQMCEVDADLQGIVREFETKKKNKQEILGLLEVMMRQTKLHLPDMEPLILELQAWENTKDVNGMQVVRCAAKHDDLSMSLALCAFAAREFGQVVGVLGVEPNKLKESLKNPDSDIVSGVKGVPSGWNEEPGGSHEPLDLGQFYTYG